MRVLSRLVAPVVLCCLATVALAVEFQFHRVPDRDGFLLSSGVLFQDTTSSALSCARLCIGHRVCQSFSFSPVVGESAQLCVGYSSFLTSMSANASAVGGTTMYTVPIRATTGQGCEVLTTTGRTRGLADLWMDMNTYLGQVFCDGEWLVFQRRQSGNVDFYRGWDDYRAGFGDVEDEYWLGLETVRQITSEGSWDLQVDLEDKEGNTAYASYSNFTLGSEDSFYPLAYDSYTRGNAGDSLAYHLNKPFTTIDSDHDLSPENCAVNFHGAWWYRNCHRVNLNGHYNSDTYGQGVIWYTWKGHYYSLPFAQMKIRRA